GFSTTGTPLRPPLNALVVRAVLDTPQGKTRFRERLGQLFTNAFKVSVLTNRVNDVAAKLKAAARNPSDATEWQNQAAAMRDRIVQRARNIADQLAMPEPATLVFNAAGEAAIREWRPKTDQGKGDAIHAALSRDGKATLHIQAGPSGCIASWRSRLLLDYGKYRIVPPAHRLRTDFLKRQRAAHSKSFASTRRFRTAREHLGLRQSSAAFC